VIPSIWHITSLLYRAGAPLTNSAGVPWSAAYVDTIGEPTADMRSNIAAEARAKIVYERLMNVTDDPGVKEALGFLMTREIAHQLSFEKALHSIQPNFPQGKLPGMPEFTNVYFNMSQGEESMRGPWNQGDDWEYVEQPTPAVDGGDGTASVELSAEDEALLLDMKARTMSDPQSNPVTGADLGAGVLGEPEARRGSPHAFDACGAFYLLSEVSQMKSNSNAIFAETAQRFSGLFKATAKAFERDALRISKQIHRAAPRFSHKHFNGK
jgi:hypothetical protein